MSAHTPGPWDMSNPMGKDHLEGREPWFWVTARTTLHLRVSACADGYVVGENAANARLIAAAPELLAELRHLVRLMEPLERDGALNIPGLATLNAARAAIAKATQP